MSIETFAKQFEGYNFPLFGWIRLPQITLTDEEYATAGVPNTASNYEFLTAIARKGYKDKGITNKEVYGQRGARELALFNKLGFVDYVLLIWKITNHADKSNIARDYGRGSAAGSLIFYLIGITSIDPIKYDLYFERFVSEARTKLKTVDGITYINGDLAPDVDIDIEQAKRAKVIEYLKDTYPSRVCKISTRTTFSGKALIKEVGKIVGGCSEEEMKGVSDMIPKVFGVVQDISKANEGVDTFKAWCGKNPRVYKIALQLRDLIRNKGSHPSGFVVSYLPISEVFPLELVNIPDTDLKEPASAFSMEFVSKLAVKVDLLGVRCCSVVAKVLKWTGEKIEDINIDNDPLIYDQLQNFVAPHGIFQLEAHTNLQVAQKVKPRNLGELSDVVAIARPGALSFLDNYLKGEDEVKNPLFSSILKTTRYVCLYQEQMMQMAHAIGFTLEEAEQLRRIVGKKKKEEAKLWESKVQDKIKENNLDPKLGELLWKILSDSADYSFNKSHAISYAALAALTIYLKFKYPQYFFQALLQEALNEPKPIEEIGKIQSELRLFGIELLPPHLLKSELEFSLEGKDIRFGLSAIKGISAATVSKIIQFKSQKSNKFELFQSAKEAGLSISVFAALIQSGCLDEVNPSESNRARLVLEAQMWNKLNDKEKTYCLSVGAEVGYNLIDALKKMMTAVKPDGKPIIIERRIQTLKKAFTPYQEIYKMNRPNQTLANFFYERSLLGYNYSVSLREIYTNPDLMSVEEVQNADDETTITMVGTVSDKPYEGTSQNGNKYARWQIADETGAITCLLFNTKQEERIQKSKEQNKRLAAPNDIVQVQGQKKGDAVFLNRIVVQSAKIYTKFKEVSADKEKEVDSDTKTDNI